MNEKYWDNRYMQGNTPWTLNIPAPPIIDYFFKQTNKTVKILIPGAGIGLEGFALYKMGFTNIFILDWSKKALEIFHNNHPEFPKNQLIQADFFSFEGKFDFIIEQTFLSSLKKKQRKDYVLKNYELLKPGGYLVGLLFAREFKKEGPPFGGTYEEYLTLFSTHFAIHNLSISTNSIKPRLHNELFIELEAKKMCNDI